MTSPDSPLSPISPDKSSEPPLDKPRMPGQTPTGFQSHMESEAKGMPPSTPPGAAQAPGPANLAGGPTIPSSGVSFNSILGQANSAQDALGTVHKQLNDKNLKLKRSQSHLVKQKLSDASSHIRAAASKLGLDLPEAKLPPGLAPIARFIAMINNGQDQLAQVQALLKKMAASGANVNPGEMMSVQVKMGLAQQEIEYTSTLLGKVIQSVTQLMNTQL